jgi:ankyrin repeat protein
MRGTAALLMLLLLLLALTQAAHAAIFAAVQQDSPDLIRRELEKNPGELNERGSGGQTPLMHAVLSGKLNAVKALLELGADATIGEKDGYTPMHGAGFQGRADIVPLLKAYGLDPNDVHRDGYAPIHRACWGREERHAATVQAFIDAGVDPQVRSRDGKTPLEATKNNPRTVAVLRAAIGGAGEL